MLRIVVSAVVAITVMCPGLNISTVQAEGEHLESNAQLLVVSGKTFADHQVGKESSVGAYVHVGYLISTRGTHVMLGYIGGNFNIGANTNVKLLTGLFMGSDGGTSAITSLWGFRTLPHSFNIFVEGDVYFPIDGKGFGMENRQYYGYSRLGWEHVGFACESFSSGFSRAKMNEFACGPTFMFREPTASSPDATSVWVAYDTTPAVDRDHVILMRFVLKL